MEYFLFSFFHRKNTKSSLRGHYDQYTWTHAGPLVRKVNSAIRRIVIFSNLAKIVYLHGISLIKVQYF